MHILIVSHSFEICTAVIVTLILTFWPVDICREIKDAELEEVFASDEQCAQELRQHLELTRSDTVIELLQPENTTDNISQLNIRHNHYYKKHEMTYLCAMLGFRGRFGAVDENYGSAHLLIPIVSAAVCVFCLWAHIFELINISSQPPLKCRLMCGLICWIILSISLTIINCNWNGTEKTVRNLGAVFPAAWQGCRYVGWFWTCVKILELILADFYQNTMIKFEKPIALTVVDFPSDDMFGTAPYPNEFDAIEEVLNDI